MMKITTALLSVSFIASCAAKKTSSADADLASAVVGSYYVEPMLCTGLIVNKPADMHADYEQILMKLVSFKSKKTDGSWADSLEVSNAYSKRGQAVDEDFGEVWYMGPLKKSGNIVSRDSLSGRNDNLKLNIVSSTNSGGKRLAVLEGTYELKGTVVGNYTYKMKCNATVVDQPSRRDNNTKNQ